VGYVGFSYVINIEAGLTLLSLGLCHPDRAHFLPRGPASGV
jgi:hypothetical protein